MPRSRRDPQPVVVVSCRRPVPGRVVSGDDRRDGRETGERRPMPAWFAPALIQAQRADKYAATVKRLGLNPDEPIFNEVFRELSLYEGAFADHLAREVDALSESSS